MRQVCVAEFIVRRDPGEDAPAITRRVFAEFRGCRLQSAALSNGRLSATVILPDVTPAYSVDELVGYFRCGIQGTGAALHAVRSLREATALELLSRLVPTH